MPKEISENFKFFIPADLEKGTNKAGAEVWKIKGLASTADIDTDGEMVDPLGLNVSKFAFINYDHNKNPGAVIGHPTKANITKSGMFIEGVLYPENKIAQEAYSLMQSLKKHGAPRGMGFSVEGKVLERDEFNKKKIKKAEIRAVALCLYPKNGSTWADIVKSGSYTEDSELEYYSETDLSDFEKALEAGAGVQTDAADAGSGAPLKRESLEGADKKKKKKSKKEKKNLPEMAKGFNFGEEYEDILSLILKTDTEILIKSINNNKMKRTDLTPEQVTKAKEAIAFLKELDLKKSEPDNDDDEDDDDGEDDEDKGLTKAEVDQLNSLLKKAESFRDKKTVKPAKKEKEEEGSLEKSISAMQDTLQKSIATAMGSLTEKLDSFSERLDEMEASLEGQVPAAKSKEFLKSLESDKDEIVKAEGKTVLSVKRDKHKIVGYLTGLVDYDNMQKSENSQMAKLAAEFESTGVIPKEAVNQLYLRHNIQIVP